MDHEARARALRVLAWTAMPALAAVLIGAQMAASCSGVRPDAAMAAIEAGDATALVEGCGHQIIPGYTYCRVREGDGAGLSRITFVVPETDCQREGPCAFIKIFFPNGEPTLGLSVERGKTRVAIQWEDLLKRRDFRKGDAGYWPFVTTIYWIDLEARERVSKSEGEIRLRVYDRDYVPLHESRDDPAFVWTWKERSGEIIRMTTGMRTYVGDRGGSMVRL